VLRFIGSALGGIFSAVTLGLVFAALTLGGIFYMYSRDLPSIESLSQYTPATISRIYSGEGEISTNSPRNGVCSSPRRIFPTW
jgi:penicillin-binding protein 1A